MFNGFFFATGFTGSNNNDTFTTFVQHTQRIVFNTICFVEQHYLFRASFNNVLLFILVSVRRNTKTIDTLSNKSFDKTFLPITRTHCLFVFIDAREHNWINTIESCSSSFSSVQRCMIVMGLSDKSHLLEMIHSCSRDQDRFSNADMFTSVQKSNYTCSRFI